MRRYLIDTAPLAAYLLGRPWAVAVIDPWLDRHEAATSILVYGEVTEYLKRGHFLTPQRTPKVVVRSLQGR